MATSEEGCHGQSIDCLRQLFNDEQGSFAALRMTPALALDALRKPQQACHPERSEGSLIFRAKQKRAAEATLDRSVPACAQPRRIDVPA
jgi:hypothetical protein